MVGSEFANTRLPKKAPAGKPAETALHVSPPSLLRYCAEKDAARRTDGAPGELAKIRIAPMLEVEGINDQVLPPSAD
jgi:hypothetical protein